MGILPLDQWKDEALEDILPPYVTLLRGLVMKLRGEEGSCCVPLFLCQRQKTNNINSDTTESTTTETYMPLLSAAVEVFVSPFGSSLRDSDGSLVRTTAMNAILNLCRITDPEVRSVLVGSDDDEDSPYAKIVKSSFYKQHTPLSPYSPLTTEQEILFLHICKNLNSCYQRSVRLLMASMSLTNKHRKPTHPHHRNNSQSQNIQYEMSPKEEAQARHADVAKS